MFGLDVDRLGEGCRRVYVLNDHLSKTFRWFYFIIQLFVFGNENLFLKCEKLKCAKIKK